MIIVRAKSAEDARAWLQQQSVNVRRRAHWARCPSTTVGFKPAAVVYLPNWPEQPDVQKITDVLERELRQVEHVLHIHQKDVR